MSVLECLKSAWDFTLEDERWFHAVGLGLAPLFEPIGANLGVLAIDFSWDDVGNVVFAPRLHLETEIESADVLDSIKEPPDYESMRACYRRAPWSGTMVELFERDRNKHHVLDGVAELGIADTLALVGGDAAGGTQFFAMSTQVLDLSNHDRWTLAGLNAHLAAVVRLRRDLSKRTDADEADAVFDADGELVHAAANGDDVATMRDRLRAMVVSQRGVRDAKELSAEQTLDSWASLVDGRFSIVDHFEERGRRLFLLYENPYFFRSPLALSRRQRDVIALAARGHNDATIAMTLGISPSTVATHLAVAKTKLGLPARWEVSRYLDWEQATLSESPVSESAHLRLLELRREPVDCSVLTEAELDVARRAARGASNQEIADARQSKPRTVANQLASVFSKLGVNSRQELAGVID